MSAAAIRSVSSYAPKKLASGNWQVRWRVFRIDGTESMRKATFEKRGQAEAHRERLTDAQLGRDGWTLTPKGDPVQADDDLVSGISVAEVVLDHYWPFARRNLAPNGRKAASYGLKVLLRETTTSPLSKAADDWLRKVAFTTKDTDPNAEGREDLIAVSMPARALDRKKIQQVVVEAGAGVSIATEHRRWGAISACLKWGAEQDLFPVITGVKVRTMAEGEDEVDPKTLPTPEELLHFIDVWAGDEFGGERLRALPWVLAGAGLRIGEAVALDVGSITEDPRTNGMWLRVNRSMSTPNANFVDDDDELIRGTKAKGPTGNRKGRTAFLPSEPAAILRTHLVEHAGKKAVDPLFAKTTGGRCTTDYIGGRWRRAARAAFAPDHHLHDMKRHTLRHYFATRALNAGVPLRALCQLGGWRSPTILLEVYIQAMESDATVAADRLEGLNW